MLLIAHLYGGFYHPDNKKFSYVLSPMVFSHCHWHCPPPLLDSSYNLFRNKPSLLPFSSFSPSLQLSSFSSLSSLSLLSPLSSFQLFFSLDRTLPRASSRQASSTEVNHQLIDIYFFLFLIHKDTHSLSCFRRRDSWPIYSQSSANIPPGHFNQEFDFRSKYKHCKKWTLGFLKYAWYWLLKWKRKFKLILMT